MSLNTKKISKKIFFKFLKLEIPNLIQIIGFASLFSLLQDSLFVNFIFSVLIMLLLNTYLNEKFFHYLSTECKDPFSIISRENLDLKQILKEIMP